MPPRNKDLKVYCEKDGWELARDTDHWYFRKVLDTGDILFTKVSHAVHKEISMQLWAKILKTQLKISEKDFWDVVKRQVMLIAFLFS